jgi:hypothetical protein
VSVSVDAPLSPGKSRQIAESTIRPLPALLAPRYRTSGHNSAHVRAVYIRTRQPAGAPLRQAWNVNTEGNCNRERARAGITLRRTVASDGTAHGATTSTPAKYSQHRHRTARVRVADYAKPATLTNTIGTAHGRIRPHWRSVKSLGNTVKSHKHRSRETTPDLPRGRTAHGDCRNPPRTGTARNLARGIGG